MTQEEKTKAVSDFCYRFFEANKEGCFGCPLGDSVGECTVRDAAESYDILAKAGLIASTDKLDEAHERFMNIGGDDKVNHPSHYCKGGIECIQAIKASMTSDGFCDYCKGNIIKYIWRWRDKGGVQDLEKAKVYLDWLIEEAKK